MGAYVDGEIGAAIGIAQKALLDLNAALKAAAGERNVHDLYVGSLVISSGAAGHPVAVLWEEDEGMVMGELYNSDAISEIVSGHVAATISPEHYEPARKTN